MGRVVGDGGAYMYIQDVLVHPHWRGRGIAKAIMREIMAFIDIVAGPGSGAYVGLMTEPHLLDFYSRYGFEVHDSASPTMRIWRGSD